MFNQKKEAMKKNMGTADAIIRVVIALIIAILFFTDIITGTLGIVLLIVGGIFILTAVVGICPIYLPFGISTRKEK